MQFIIKNIVLTGLLSTLVAAVPPTKIGTPSPNAGSMACKLRAQACRYQIKSTHCTPEWKTEVQRCMPASCVADTIAQCSVSIEPRSPPTKIGTPSPVAGSLACKLRSQACRYQVKSKICTAEWKTELQRCMPASCVVDVIASCDAPVEPRSEPATVGCNVMARACRYQITAEKCSEEWKKEVMSCLPESCQALVSDTISQCPASAESKRDEFPAPEGRPIVVDDSKPTKGTEFPAVEGRPIAVPNTKPTKDTKFPAPEGRPIVVGTTQGCAIMAKACRFQITAKKCTSQWKKQIKSCMPASCRQNISDAISQCFA